MKKEEIENVELSFLTLDDYQELKTAMVSSYRNLPDSYWKENQIKTLIDKFKEGQVVIKINGMIAGCALSIIVEYEKF
ncbi:MAG: carbon-nitrogen hydrolase, partial [Bacteroidota bacterium]|nr:carbon-nitrogen hydrolase [Bacteroidota bacterium]